jgi:uncharacterized damage-inducible protein DinB
MPALFTVVSDLLAYTMWADRQVLGALRAVSPEDLTRDTGTSFGSILGTMAHVVGAERLWVSRFAGDPLPHVPDIADYPDLRALIFGAEEVWAALGALVAGLDEEQLQRETTWTNSRGETYTQELWRPMLHMVNHSTYHRGQVVSLLRQLGYTPVSTDLVYYFAGR